MEKRKMIAVSEDIHTKIKIAAAQRKLSVKDYLELIVTNYDILYRLSSINAEENES